VLTAGASVKYVALGALALFVFSIPSENGVSIPGVGSMSRILGLLAAGFAFVSLFDRGRLRFRSPSLYLVIAALFVAWAGTTYFWSVAPSNSISRTMQFVQLFVFAWMVHQVARTDRHRDLLMQAFVLGCYVMVAVALVAYIGSARGGYRDVVFSANSFAIVAALGIPMAWGLMLRRAFPWLQALNTVYPLFALLAVVLAASRGGLLTAAVALLVIPLTLPNLSVARRSVLIAGVAAIVVSVATWLPQAVPDLERNLDRLARVDEDLLGGTMTGRTDIWAAGAQVFATSPIIGVGIGSYTRAVEPIYGRAVGAHNAFWSVTVTSGLVGGLLFVAMFIVVLAGLFVNPPRRIDYMVLFAALLVGAFPSNAENNKFLWYILAVLASAKPIMVRIAVADVARRLTGRNATAVELPSATGSIPSNR